MFQKTEKKTVFLYENRTGARNNGGGVDGKFNDNGDDDGDNNNNNKIMKCKETMISKMAV